MGKYDNTKWDVREWTKDQKTQWQKVMFKEGYFWCDGARISNLNDEVYFL